MMLVTVSTQAYCLASPHKILSNTVKGLLPLHSAQIPLNICIIQLDAAMTGNKNQKNHGVHGK